MIGAYYTAKVIVTVEKELDRFWARTDADAQHLAKIRARNIEGLVVETEVDVTRIKVQVEA